MTIIDFYHSIGRKTPSADDFALFQFRPGFNIGYDFKGYLCIVINSSNSARTPLLQQTKLLSVECNRHLSYIKNGSHEDRLVHIIRCFSTVEKEQEIFLEVIDATMLESASDEEVMSMFQTLSSFFANKEEPSDTELIGLYAELDAIKTFSSNITMSDYWQSKDRMKFDFSFTDSLKLDVKATTNSFRTHHFKHEQLITDIYDIYILSYMLRYDDKGLSLYDLIYEVKPFMKNNPKKLLRLDTVLKNVSENRLQEMKFSPEYTNEKRHFYLAESIPKFAELTPDGVANAEYDCNLDNIEAIKDEDFISIVLGVLSKENDNEQIG